MDSSFKEMNKVTSVNKMTILMELYPYIALYDLLPAQECRLVQMLG